jgi:hypothetical protein
MKNILFIICSIILPILSLKQVKPKLCINCKHFITDNDNGKYGKCSLFPKKEGKIHFLVNGVNEELYYHCSISREMNHMCGEEGKYYKKKIVKTRKNSEK